MRTQPSFRLLARRVAALAVLAFGLAACGDAVGDPNAAAVVDGVVIELDTVQQRFESVRRDPQLAQQLAADEDGSFKARVQARLLTQMIQAELLSQAAEDIGVEITDADIEAERQSIVEQVGGQEAFEQIIEDNQLSEDDVTSQIRDLVVERKVEEALGEDVDVSDADVEAFYEENRGTRYDRVRASHILVPTREEADAALSRARAGEDFAVLARELSQDPGSAQSGGDLGEFTRGRLVPEFEEAAFGANVGDLVGPIQTEFGWHVIKVTARTNPTLEEVREEIRTELTEQQRAEARTAFRREHFADAHVQVNPRLGRWNPEAGEVESGDPLGAAEPVEPDVGELPLTPQDGQAPGQPVPAPDEQQQ